MKDKQIKYLLTLKRKFESIRRDQYVFSERNPLPAYSANSSPSISSSANTLAMQKLYQTINYTLQSIEFKSILIHSFSSSTHHTFESTDNNSVLPFQFLVLDTVTEQQRKPNNTRETSQQPAVILQKKINQTFENTSHIDDQENALIKNNNKKAVPIIKEQSISLVKPVQNSLNIFKPKSYPLPLPLPPTSSQLPTKQIAQISNGPIVEELVEQKSNVNESVFTANSEQNGSILLDQQQQNDRLTQAQQFPANLFENPSLFCQNSSPKSPQLNSKRNEVRFIINQYQSADEMNSMIADESEIHSIDDYLNFETPKKNIFRDDESDPVLMYENINEILLNKFYAQNNIDILPNMQTNVKEEITGIVPEEEEDQYEVFNSLLFGGSSEQERISILKDFNAATPSQSLLNKSKDNQTLQTIKKAQNGGTANKNESGATVKYPSNESERSRKKFLQTEKRIKIDFDPVINTLSDDADDDEEEEEMDFDEGIDEGEQDEDDEVEVQYENQYDDSENKQCSSREYGSSGKKQIAKKLDFKSREDDYKSYVRGPYNFYSEELKMKAIRDYFKFQDIKRAAEINEVKVKNLKRWITVGHKRKEGGGRKKEDPEMEELVFEWLKERYLKQRLPATRNEIREKALEFSNKKDKFKASKGWLEKFFTRYDCKHMSKKDTFNASLKE